MRDDAVRTVMINYRLLMQIQSMKNEKETLFDQLTTENDALLYLAMQHV
jgi:hypothetical protein